MNECIVQYHQSNNRTSFSLTLGKCNWRGCVHFDFYRCNINTILVRLLLLCIVFKWMIVTESLILVFMLWLVLTYPLYVFFLVILTVCDTLLKQLVSI